MIEERLNVGNLISEAILRLDNEIYLTLHAQEKQRELEPVTPLRRGGQRVVGIVETARDSVHRVLVAAGLDPTAVGIPGGKIITCIAEVNRLARFCLVVHPVTGIQHLHVHVPVNIDAVIWRIGPHLEDGIFGNRHHHTVIGEIGIDGITLLIQTIGVTLDRKSVV